MLEVQPRSAPSGHRAIRRAALTLALTVGGWYASSAAAAQSLPDDGAKPAYRAARVTTPPVVDGDLSDQAWRQAAVMDDLTQIIPVRGGKPTERTEVRVVYDDDSLYLAFYAYESDPSAATRTMLRYRWDSIWQLDDVVRFAVDTFHDHRRGYAFSFNAFGTKQDAQLDNGGWLSTWDEVWSVRTRRQADGWTAEVRIPFRILRFPESSDASVWGFQVERLIKRGNETIQWAPEPPTFSLSRLEYAGHLEGIVGLRRQRNAQVVPYVAGGRRRLRATAIDNDVDVGADAKIAVTPSMALDLTYNTNFAQVEVDDQQVNLTRFPLFFPERREFFLENAQLFNVGLGQELQMFFSRRIGLAGGQPLPLLGGARLTGKAGPFDIGVLSTQTETTDGVIGGNQSVGRVRWNVGSRSYVGGLATAVTSEVNGGQTFAADGRWWVGRYLQVDGFVGVLGDGPTSGRPAAYLGSIIYEQDLLGITLRTIGVDRDFNPALGFVRRRDFRRQELRLRRGWRLNHPLTRKVDISGDLSYLTDPQGRLDTRMRTLAASNELPWGDIVRATYEGTFDRLEPTDDPFIINPSRGIRVPPGAYTFSRWIAAYQGFEGRRLTGNVEVQGGRFYGGDRTAATFAATWRPSPHLVLSADYQVNDVSLPQGAFTTHLQRGRISLPITARAVADASVQWNGLTRELNTQVRLHLIYGRDSNFYIVYTDYQTDVLGRLVEQSRALQTKLTYRWYW